nr:RNA-directed DNA polymerase, eukaryota [Tanacetum cinerariifolium]
DSDDESVDSQEASILKDKFSNKNSDMKEIPKTVLDKSEHVGNISPTCNEVRMETRVEEKSEDPFYIYDTLNKKKPTKSVKHSDGDIQYPPGFILCDRPQVNSNLDHINQTKVLDKEPGAKASFQEDVNVSDFIKVRQTMGYKMEGCIKDFKEIVSSQGETKMEKVDLFNIKACWGNINFDYVVSPSVGNSGGILCVWDPNLFYKENSTVSDYFTAIMGNWLPNNKKLLVISVYAPQELAENKSLWKYLNLLISRWNGEVLLMGDFNEVRLEEEMYGSIFNSRRAAAFNSFIVDSGLVEVPSGGFSFTWSHRSATKMSRLDRFLVSEDLQRSCPNLSSLNLDRYLSDHRPILLRELNVDYGPTPFCFFHNWFDLDGFDSFISNTWCNIKIIEPNVMFKMAKKLKILKGHIRVWVKGKRATASNLKKDLKSKLSNIDSLIDKGKVSSAIFVKPT